MRKLKQSVSLILVLALSLVLTIPVFAEPVTVESPFISSAKVTLSDMVSRETVSGVTRAYSVITVKTGSTLTVEHNKTLAENPGCTIREGYVNGRVYDVVAGGRTLNTGVDDGVPFTLTDEQIGLWFFGDGSTPNGFFVNVIAGDGANPAAPATEIAKPTNDKLTVNGVLADPTVYKIDGNIT